MDNVSINTDNDVLKDRIRSYSTLNSLYHETRQEIDLLNKQIYVKDNIIADLKARLGKYERIYMTVGDNESVVIGPSKSLLESLCKEICKLKQKRNDMEFKAARQAEVKHVEKCWEYVAPFIFSICRQWSLKYPDGRKVSTVARVHLMWLTLSTST